MLSRKENICYECSYIPNYHSFHLLNENEKHIYFYSCPSETRYYNDPDGLITHIKHEIKKINKPWTWIFNAELFGIKHATCTNMHTQLLKLFSKYAQISLKNIIIINQNITFKAYLQACWYFIPQYLRTKIIFDYQNNFSKLLKIDNRLYNLQHKNII